MQQGLIPENDPQLLTRAVLGLYNSVWHWYRPGGTLDLVEVGRFFVGRQLAILGARTDLADATFAKLAAAAACRRDDASDALRFAARIGNNRTFRT